MRARFRVTARQGDERDGVQRGAREWAVAVQGHEAYVRRVDRLEAHHMPQAALKFTSRDEGGALVMSKAEHAMTRTYGWKGVAAKAADAGRSFRSILAQDIRDVRGNVGTHYDAGLRALIDYYYENYPDLMKR